MGIGDWGLGIGDWGLGPIPNPQSPIPNPQSPITFLIELIFYKKIKSFILKKILFVKNKKMSIIVSLSKYIYYIHIKQILYLK